MNDEEDPVAVTVEPPPRWAMMLLAGAALLVVVAVGIYLTVTTANQQELIGQTRDVVVSVRRFEAHIDCSIGYGSIRQEAVDNADAVARQAEIDFAGYLLGNPSATTAVIIQDREDLATADARVLALPSRVEMVEKGFTLDGVDYPPCPTVVG